MIDTGTTVTPQAAPRKRRRIFMWTFIAALAILALVLILTGHPGAMSPLTWI
jgi:hypothetical protein